MPSAIFSPRSRTVIRSETRMTTLMSCSMSRTDTSFSSRTRWTKLVEPRRLLGVHPGRRLVQQQHLRLQRERPGDLEPALVAVGQVAGVARRRAADADEVEQLAGESRASRSSRRCHGSRKNVPMMPALMCGAWRP